jgi:hypothetical protein
MLRTAVLVALLLLTLGAAPASAEEVRAGPCEVDGCVYACVHVRQECPGGTDACVLFAFRLWCV